MTAPLVLNFRVDPESNKTRIDAFLARQLRNYTRFRIQRLVAAGQVRIDAKPASTGSRVFTGQVVRVALLEPPDKLYPPEPLPVEVLFEDDRLIVVNKPPLQVAHPVGKYQNGTLCNALQHHFDRQSPLRGLLRPGIVHRLDRETSGVTVVSKEHTAHRRLTRDFQEGRVAKTYLALLEGTLEANCGLIEFPIGRSTSGRGVLVTAGSDARKPKRAQTRFESLERRDSATLVRAIPLTGRIHQIRVHFAQLGHPVIGDAFYAAYGALKPDDDRDAIARNGGASRHLLHAESLGFAHPANGEWVEFEAPLPDDFLAALHALRHGVREPKLVREM